MEQMGALMQVMSDPSSQFEHLPLVDMPLLRDFAPYYLDWLAHPSYKVITNQRWYPILVNSPALRYTHIRERISFTDK